MSSQEPQAHIDPVFNARYGFCRGAKECPECHRMDKEMAKTMTQSEIVAEGLAMALKAITENDGGIPLPDGVEM